MSSGSKLLSETINLSVTNSCEFFFLRHKKGQHTLTSQAALTSDGKNLYLHMNGLGVMKLSQGVDGQTPGKLKIHNPELRSGEDISLVFIKDKLILRSSEATPYRIVDPETLEEKEYKEEEEEEEEDEEKKKEKKNRKTLKWEANEDTGRSLTFSPLFTDGHFLYIISKLKVPKLNGKSFILQLYRG